MNSYKVLKFDEAFVYLIQDGKIKKVARDLFDFDIKLGDTVDYIQDGDIVVVLPSQKATDEVVDDEASTKSALLQGILNLFLETLAIHNNDLGNLKKIFSQLLVTLFMAWSLIGVILIEFLLLLESLIVFVWWLLVKGVRSLHLVDNSRRYMAYRKEKKATQNRENREEEERLLRLALAQEKTKQTETKATDDASASEEQAPTSKEDTEEN
ncbi:hypothetical protein ACTQ42_00170 [Streptococcus alactolyticus]|jgi:hypothetical protein|uniref:Uncharacterized protein n=2 Tax=Streptococcus alactolyticus TaxID=29389 RepID=A0A6N7X4F8_STRAY|nr:MULTISPECIES: hypothetical protein [Streptococcus]MDE2587706.1 hypothetical protein [Lactobacillales bacterium]MCF2666260.1 hypothetical protein [Streptococcus alactolyticus]MCF2677896.1 hypothetical protein [Streptococcus alactolyticus]MCI6904727.1 hypothetical protein [Streptococcus alactolyticus]MDD7361417.1 hypothetical protein [Streptococcus alactolyticus]